MPEFVVRALGQLGVDLVLAPERHLAARLGAGASGGVPLGELVVERVEHVPVRALGGAVVLDTTHARDGVLDVRAAAAGGRAVSAKKRVCEGDVLVSRLRPYLRQIALAHPDSFACAGVRALVCSTEFYVLSARDGKDAAFLVPFLLGAAAQTALIAGQEGGHHPRVPRETLLALRVPRALVAARAATSRRIRAALAGLYSAQSDYACALTARSGSRALR